MAARTISSTSCRIDAIYGREDALYRDKIEQLAGVLRTAPYFGELVLLPDAGHWVQYEAAEAFREALLRLLRN